MIFENKTVPYVRPKRLFPRIGHLFALGLMIGAGCLAPPEVMTYVSFIAVGGMAMVSVIFLIHMPIKTLLSDRRNVSNIRRKEAEAQRVDRARKSQREKHYG